MSRHGSSALELYSAASPLGQGLRRRRRHAQSGATVWSVLHALRQEGLMKEKWSSRPSVFSIGLPERTECGRVKKKRKSVCRAHCLVSARLKQVNHEYLGSAKSKPDGSRTLDHQF